MKVGELYFSLGLQPDASWGRVRGMVSGLRNQMRGARGVLGSTLGGGPGIGGDGTGWGRWMGPANERRFDKTNRNINWATATGDPFGAQTSRAGGGGAGGKGDPTSPTFFKRIRQGINDLNLFRRALYGTFAVQTIQTVAGLADSYTNMHNRLRVLTGSQEEAEKQYQRGREVAAATRSDVESTVEGFVRVKNATKEMGLNYEQTWQLMTSFQQSLQMSGASTSEAASGMRQLTQALAKGKLDGDEFKSLAENMPNILTTLQEATGKTEGQLRAMSEAGQLTRKVVVDAFTKMKDKIATDFGNTLPTVGQQFTLFKNDMIDSVGAFAKMINLAKIAQVAFTAFGIVIKSLMVIIGAVLWPIGKLIEGFQFLWKSAKEGSDVALAALIGIGAALTALIIPNLIAIGTIIYSTIIPALIRMAVAAWASAGPYALIIAAVAAVVYGIIKIVKHWDEVKAAVSDVADGIVDGIGAAFAFIAELPIIKQLIWLVKKLDELTGLSDALFGAVDTPSLAAQWVMGQQGKTANDPNMTQTPWGAATVNDAAAAAGGKGAKGGGVHVATTVNIYANDAADAKRKFEADQINRMNRAAAAALSR